VGNLVDKVKSIDFEVIDKKQKLTFAGIAFSAILAISCCIGPAVFLLTGASISFLGSLSFLAPRGMALLTNVEIFLH
jgi:hypothetical protein